MHEGVCTKCIFNIKGEGQTFALSLNLSPLFLLLLLLDLITRCSGEVVTSPRVKGSLDKIVQATALMASLVSFISMAMVMVEVLS